MTVSNMLNHITESQETEQFSAF